MQAAQPGVQWPPSNGHGDGDGDGHPCGQLVQAPGHLVEPEHDERDLVLGAVRSGEPLLLCVQCRPRARVCLGAGQARVEADACLLPLLLPAGAMLTQLTSSQRHSLSKCMDNLCVAHDMCAP